MKKSLLSLFFALPLYTLAQIPNPGMETWTGGNPDQWSSNNLTGLAVPVTQSADAHGGTKAVQLEVVSAFGGSPYPGLISSTVAGSNGFAISQHYNSFSFYYKSNLIGSDELGATVGFYDFNTQPTAGGANTFTGNTAVYTQAVIPITIISTNPTTCLIAFSISNSSTANIGSWARIDDLAFSNSTGIDDLTTSGITLSSPNPNPAAGIALVPFTLDRTTVADIRIFDLNGRLVQNVLNQELSAGKYKAEVNADALSSGVYTIVMRAADQVLQSKLVVR